MNVYLRYLYIAMNATIKSFGAGDGPIFLDLVGCIGTEENLLQCPSRGLEVHSCSHADDAGVQCVPGNYKLLCEKNFLICIIFLIGCTEHNVRLMDGANHTEGRVEICLNNEWGTVCDQMWDEDDAAVVCSQLALGSNGE